MHHPVLWALQVRAASPCGGGSSHSVPTLQHWSKKKGTRSDTSQCLVTGRARDGQGLRLSPPRHRRGRTHHFPPHPSLSSSPQVLLLGAPPRAGSAGCSGGDHHLPHLHGLCGAQKVLQHHGVPSLQTRLVPQGLHPGRSRSLAAGARQALSSTRACLTHAPYVSPAGTGSARWHFLLPVPSMQRQGKIYFGYAQHGDPNPFQVGVRLPGSQDRRVQALHHARACPCSPGPPLSPESGLDLRGGVGNRVGGAKSRDALRWGSRASSVFLSPSDCHRGRTTTRMQH